MADSGEAFDDDGVDTTSDVSCMPDLVEPDLPHLTLDSLEPKLPIRRPSESPSPSPSHSRSSHSRHSFGRRPSRSSEYSDLYPSDEDERHAKTAHRRTSSSSSRSPSYMDDVDSDVILASRRKTFERSETPSKPLGRSWPVEYKAVDTESDNDKTPRLSKRKPKAQLDTVSSTKSNSSVPSKLHADKRLQTNQHQESKTESKMSDDLEEVKSVSTVQAILAKKLVLKPSVDSDPAKSSFKADGKTFKTWPDIALAPLTADERKAKLTWKEQQDKLELEQDAGCLMEDDDEDDQDTLGNGLSYHARMRNLINVQVSNLDADSCLELLERWKRCLTSHNDTDEKNKEIAADIWQSCTTPSQVWDLYESIHAAFDKLSKAIVNEHKLVGKDAKDPQALQDGMKDVSNSYRKLFLATRFASMTRRSFNAADFLSTIQHIVNQDRQASNMAEDIEEEDNQKPQDFEKLLDAVLDEAKRLGMKRIKGHIYEPVSIDGRFTRSYKEYGKDGEIGEFIEDVCQGRESNTADKRRLAKLLNSKPGYKDNVERRMATMKTDKFPEVDRERNWHSFKNGLYNVAEDRFYSYTSTRFQHLPSNKVACAYHDTVFEHQEYNWYLRNGGELDFMNIPTPVDKIIKLQEWTLEEAIWIYAEGGALLFSKRTATHPLRQHLPTHIGPGGIGKTTLLKMFSAFFHPLDVAQFKTKDEEVFGFERLPDCYIWMGYDMGKDWKIDHTFLYTLIDGGWLKISRKFKKSILYYVEQYGMIAMNEYLNLPDTGGAWSRRNLLHIWKNPPENGGDRGLEAEGVRCLGAIMKKCVLALRYLENIRLKEKSVCKETMPPSMWENLQEMRRTTNPMMTFFESEDVVKTPKDLLDQGFEYYIDMAAFNKKFKEFCKDQGISKRTALDATTGHDVLRNNKCHITRGERPDLLDQTRWRMTGWIVGCTLKEREATCKVILQTGVLKSGSTSVPGVTSATGASKATESTKSTNSKPSLDDGRRTSSYAVAGSPGTTVTLLPNRVKPGSTVSSARVALNEEQKETQEILKMLEEEQQEAIVLTETAPKPTRGLVVKSSTTSRGNSGKSGATPVGPLAMTGKSGATPVGPLAMTGPKEATIKSLGAKASSLSSGTSTKLPMTIPARLRKHSQTNTVGSVRADQRE